MLKRTAMIVLMLGMMLVCCTMVFGAGRRDKSSSEGVVKIGAPAPDFTLRDLEGKSISLQSLHGKVVILTFWATWCPACRSEMPSLNALYRRLARQGVVVLGINGGEPTARVKSFMEKENLDFPVVMDESGDVHALYQIRQYPTMFIIDRQGRLVDRHIGLRDWNAPEHVQTLRSLIGNAAEEKR